MDKITSARLQWLQEAVKVGDADTVRLLIGLQPELIEKATDRHDVTLLHKAAEYGHPSVVEALIEMRPEMAAVKTQAGFTPSDFGQPEMKDLIKATAARVQNQSAGGKPPEWRQRLGNNDSEKKQIG